jgi:hypothetical protein
MKVHIVLRKLGLPVICMVTMGAIAGDVLSKQMETCNSTMTIAQQTQRVWWCCTRYGRCGLNQPKATGSICYCASEAGPVEGAACE